MAKEYGVGMRRALLAAQGVGFEPTPHLDGDAKWAFVGQTLDLVLRRDEVVSQEFLNGAREGAVKAWERRIAQEIVQ